MIATKEMRDARSDMKLLLTIECLPEHESLVRDEHLREIAEAIVAKLRSDARFPPIFYTSIRAGVAR